MGVLTMPCGKEVSKTLTPIFNTDFGVTTWCHLLPFVPNDDPNVFYMSDNITATPEITLILHILIFVCSFVVGYAVKPVLNTSRFEIVKSEFSSREKVLKEQLQSAEGEKYDIEDQIKMLNKHLEEVRQERLELDKKTFQIIQDFTNVQQAIVPAENKVTNRALTARIERLEKLIEAHERAAFPLS